LDTTGDTSVRSVSGATANVITFSFDLENVTRSRLRPHGVRMRGRFERSSSEWEQINQFYLGDRRGAGGDLGDPHELFASVKTASQLWPRHRCDDDARRGWHFSRWGELERPTRRRASST
jgi:hypothetical protein